MHPDEITIRNDLQPGDMGYIIHLHGKLYAQEAGYKISFESKVALAFHEFWQQYDPTLDRLWICEYQAEIIGFLLLMHRDHQTVQLRFFLVLPRFRNIGLGKKLMLLFVAFMKEKGYRHAFLWTASALDVASALYRKAGFVLSEEKVSTQFGIEVMEQRYDLWLP